MTNSPERLERELRKTQLLEARQEAAARAAAMDDERLKRETEFRNQSDPVPNEGERGVPDPEDPEPSAPPLPLEYVNPVDYSTPPRPPPPAYDVSNPVVKQEGGQPRTLPLDNSQLEMAKETSLVGSDEEGVDQPNDQTSDLEEEVTMVPGPGKNSEKSSKGASKILANATDQVVKSLKRVGDRMTPNKKSPGKEEVSRDDPSTLRDTSRGAVPKTPAGLNPGFRQTSTPRNPPRMSLGQGETPVGRNATDEGFTTVSSNIGDVTTDATDTENEGGPAGAPDNGKPAEGPPGRKLLLPPIGNSQGPGGHPPGRCYVCGGVPVIGPYQMCPRCIQKQAPTGSQRPICRRCKQKEAVRGRTACKE